MQFSRESREGVKAKVTDRLVFIFAAVGGSPVALPPHAKDGRSEHRRSLGRLKRSWTTIDSGKSNAFHNGRGNEVKSKVSQLATDEKLTWAS